MTSDELLASSRRGMASSGSRHMSLWATDRLEVLSAYRQRLFAGDHDVVGAVIDGALCVDGNPVAAVVSHGALVAFLASRIRPDAFADGSTAVDVAGCVRPVPQGVQRLLLIVPNADGQPDPFVQHDELLALRVGRGGEA